MRLTTEQIAAIIRSCEQALDGLKCELRLYGSRVKDYQSGRDLKLLMILEGDEAFAIMQPKTRELMDALAKHTGEEDITVLICTRAMLRTDEKVKEIMPESLFLTVVG